MPKPNTLELKLTNPAANQWPIQQFEDKKHLTNWLAENADKYPDAEVKGKKVLCYITEKDENNEDVETTIEVGTLTDI